MTTTSSTLSLSYTLNLPKDTPSPPNNLPSKQTHNIPLSLPAGASTTKEYYAALRESIAKAKNIFGDDLTVWRDLEMRKKKKRKRKAYKEVLSVPVNRQYYIDVYGELWTFFTHYRFLGQFTPYIRHTPKPPLLSTYHRASKCQFIHPICVSHTPSFTGHPDPDSHYIVNVTGLSSR
ncbi:hypothetical protein ABKN59_008042 [Abortiporus biennis]